MFTTKFGPRSWRQDLYLFISRLCRRGPGRVPVWESQKPSSLDSAKVELRKMPASHSWLGPSLLLKGEISGDEDLLIDGSLKGVVRLDQKRVMIGPRANVEANISAREVVVRGNVKGNVRGRQRIEIRRDGSVTGDLTSPQVFIEEGALFRGSLQIEKGTEKGTDETAPSEIEAGHAKVIATCAGANSI